MVPCLLGWGSTSILSTQPVLLREIPAQQLLLQNTNASVPPPASPAQSHPWANTSPGSWQMDFPSTDLKWWDDVCSQALAVP